MTIVHKILKQMPGLGQPQRKFLATLFVTILVLRGRVNFRNLSRYCDYSERTIARQFREPFYNHYIHQRVLHGALDPRSELVSAHDASFIPKSGKQTFGLGHFFNGCTSRAERGLEISTLAVVDVTRRCALTLAVAQTPPRKERPEGRAGRHAGRLLQAATARSIGIACRRASPIIAWTATMRRRNILMKSSASICMPSPNCGATPTACFSTPVRTQTPWGTAEVRWEGQLPRLEPFRGPRHEGRGTASASVYCRGVAQDASASLAPCGPPEPERPGKAAFHRFRLY